jgi:hypothetical protein
MSTRVTTVCLCLVGMLNASAASAQDMKLVARIEVDEHDKAFTVRLFLKNNGDKDAEVAHGYGGGGMSVVPQFDVAGLSITPPTYLSPPRARRCCTGPSRWAIRRSAGKWQTGSPQRSTSVN